MKTIDIEEINDIKEELDELKNNDYLFLKEDGEEKYVVVPLKLLTDFNQMFGAFDDGVEGESKVKIISNQPMNLSYDEYLSIKKQLNKALDDTFKPNPEKLN